MEQFIHQSQPLELETEKYRNYIGFQNGCLLDPLVG